MKSILKSSLVSKIIAQYTNNANHPDEQCRYCKHWLGDYNCDKVMGHVLPGGWCKYFVDK